MYLIDLNTDKKELSSWLQDKKWLAASENIQSIQKPGEGNMNVVLRIRTSERSLILKQSRPYVNKYQQIPAPLDRIEVEYKFYQNIEGAQVSNLIPKILAYDASNYLLLMEDLGEGQDMSSCYASRSIEAVVLTSLVQFINKVLQQKVSDFPENKSLRELNHQHIFVLPFMEDNGFQLDDIQDGLQALSLPYKQDQSLKYIIKQLGDKYLSAGTTLLHGDYYPGSWLQAGDQSYIIDPEFSFLGFPEFDLGVMSAHLILIKGEVAIIDEILSQYEASFQKQIVQQIAGVEIMRRLIGLAQLPLERSLEEKTTLLKTAKQLIIS